MFLGRCRAHHLPLDESLICPAGHHTDLYSMPVNGKRQPAPGGARFFEVFDTDRQEAVYVAAADEIIDMHAVEDMAPRLAGRRADGRTIGSRIAK